MISGTPAVADGTAYVGTYDPDYDTSVYAYVEGEKPPAPQVSISLDESGPKCAGEDVVFDYEITFEGVDDPTRRDELLEGYTYEWKVDYAVGDDEEPTFEHWNSAGPVAVHAYDEPGTYEVEIAFRDSLDRTTSASTTVEVVECEGPTAQIETDPAEPTELPRGTDVTLDASTSEAEAGVENYEWDVDDDGNFERTGDVEQIWITIGEDRNAETRTITLRVTDDAGKVDTTSVTISAEHDDDYENC